jgi:hypothetical protein
MVWTNSLVWLTLRHWGRVEEFFQAGCDFYSRAAASLVRDWGIDGERHFDLGGSQGKFDVLLHRFALGSLGLSSGANGKDAWWVFTRPEVHMRCFSMIEFLTLTVSPTGRLISGMGISWVEVCCYCDRGFVTQLQTHIQDFLESYHGFFKNDIMVVFMKQMIYLECLLFWRSICISCFCVGLCFRYCLFFAETLSGIFGVYLLNSFSMDLRYPSPIRVPCWYFWADWS